MELGQGIALMGAVIGAGLAVLGVGLVLVISAVALQKVSADSLKQAEKFKQQCLLLRFLLKGLVFSVWLSQYLSFKVK